MIIVLVWLHRIVFSFPLSADTHHTQFKELENKKLSDCLGLMDETLIGEGDDENKGKILGKGVGQFHDDIQETDDGKIFQQTG